MSNGSINKGSLVKGVKKVADKPIKQVSLLSVTTSPSGIFQAGSKYYNSTDKLIYTSVTDNSWTDAITEKPEFGTVYIYDNSGTIQYYQWNGVNLVQTDVNNIVFITGTQTITGNKTFSGSVALGDNATAQTKPTSDTSDAPATTQFVKDYAQDGEWQKPADWVDIRSGALPNSIYFLVAHSKPTESGGVYTIANYKILKFLATVSNSGTYDVFVDGFKVATTENSVATTIDFEALYNSGVLSGGYDTNYPEQTPSLTTHIVRITPTNSQDVFESIANSDQYNTGILWAHITVTTFLGYKFGDTGNIFAPLMEAITAPRDFIFVKNGNRIFPNCPALISIPILNFDFETNPQTNPNLNYAFYHCKKLKKIHIKKLKQTDDSLDCYETLSLCESLEEIIFEESNIFAPQFRTTNANNVLKRLPSNFSFHNTKLKGKDNSLLAHLEDTVFYMGDCPETTRALVQGNSSNPCLGVKGLIVSPEAPFDGTEPQINVSYTGMDRAALVRLFKSLPTGLAVVGSPTITDGVVSGFSSSNYVVLNVPFISANYDTIDIKIRFKTPSTFASGASNVFTGGSIGTINSLRLWTSSSGSFVSAFGHDINIPSEQKNLEADTWYIVEFNADSTASTQTAKLYNDDNTLKAETNAISKTIDISTVLTFGGRYGSPIGSIDFNNTYIKGNGVDIFNWKGIARSLSCVGATGTADLTADDKAIAENKGWSLILS